MIRSIGRLLMLAFCLSTLAHAELPSTIARIHYHRSAGDYEGWGLHVWGPDLDLVQDVTWGSPQMPTGQDAFGLYFDLPLQAGGGEVGFILHRGNIKNVAKDMIWKITPQGREIWQLEGDPVLYTACPKVEAGGPAPAAKVPRPAPGAVRTIPGPEAIGPGLEAPLDPATRNQIRLQVELLAEQEKRQAAEQALKNVEQSLALAKQAAVHTPPSAPDAQWNLKARTGAGTRERVWIAVSFLLIMVLALALGRVRGRKLRQDLAALEAEVILAKERVRQEAEERQNAEQRILHLANYDELTGLPNRAILNQAIAQALAKYKRYKKQLAILFIDLDRFKFINDTLGHGAGDYVLKTVSERFKTSLRDSDLIVRLGGDEFVVLVEELGDPKSVAGIAQKLLAVAQLPFFIKGQECHVTASIGISTFPGDAKDAEILIKNADIAMYRAKEQGKNNFQYYSEQMNMHSLQRLALESSLRHALERDEFKLHYQPIIDTQSQRIVGVEALVRWQTPDMGMVGPLQFIPIAEDTGLIGDIGRWVLETACLQGNQWRAKGHILNISVNLSPRQLNERGLVTEFQDIFKKTGFPASQLTLEITESLMLNNPDETVVVLHELKDLGIRIAIDDFGTGYSSLSYLRRFPIDTLKIDRSFLQDIPGDPDSQALTAAVIALGHSLHLDVVAEGVETDEQRNFLAEHHCQHLQGFWFSKPKAGEDITRMLA